MFFLSKQIHLQGYELYRFIRNVLNIFIDNLHNRQLTETNTRKLELDFQLNLVLKSNPRPNYSEPKVPKLKNLDKKKSIGILSHEYWNNKIITYILIERNYCYIYWNSQGNLSIERQAFSKTK